MASRTKARFVVRTLKNCGVEEEASHMFKVGEEMMKYEQGDGDTKPPPPGAQPNVERWSLVFFTRPGNSVVLRALVEDSHHVAEAVLNATRKNFKLGERVEEWFV
ncbi:hypothetical protein EDD18DRAFT_1112140 [Armillaria luteobubalina]|uniref:Uncharacterized protein n=1 Tax=Armillaria luteobubalina TaxID=153913 RepID=A0AA39PIY6_9AGAR|nr:hypothetical protein EDD18DRAFT_1112140 [Armillaria luteobubalina]